MKKIQFIIIVTFISEIVFSQTLFFPFEPSCISTNKDNYSFYELDNFTAEKKLNIEFLDQVIINGNRIDSIKSDFKGSGEDWRFEHNAYFEYKNNFVDKVITESYDHHHGPDVITNIHKISYTPDNKLELIETTHSSKIFGYNNYESLNFEYNTSGIISKSTAYYEDEWITSESTHFTYDSVDISFAYNLYWYYEEQWALMEQKELKLADPNNLSSEYWHWYEPNSETHEYYKESYGKEVINDTSFIVTYSSIDKNDKLYQNKIEYVIDGNYIEAKKKFSKYDNDTALSYFTKQELLFDEHGRLSNERSFEYNFFPCDIEVFDGGVSYTRNEIDPDTIIIEIDTVTTKYIYENNKITVKNWSQWGYDCSYCNSEKITTYFLSDNQTNSVDDEMNATNENKDIKIYPNPCYGTLNIESTIKNTYLKIEIINVNGQLVYSDYSTNRTKIRFPQIPSGLYLIRINNSEITKIQKLIIE